MLSLSEISLASQLNLLGQCSTVSIHPPLILQSVSQTVLHNDFKLSADFETGGTLVCPLFDIVPILNVLWSCRMNEQMDLNKKINEDAQSTICTLPFNVYVFGPVAHSTGQWTRFYFCVLQSVTTPRRAQQEGICKVAAKWRWNFVLTVSHFPELFDTSLRSYWDSYRKALIWKQISSCLALPGVFKVTYKCDDTKSTLLDLNKIVASHNPNMGS